MSIFAICISLSTGRFDLYRGDAEPTVVEGKGSRFAGWVLDAYEAGLVCASAFHYVQPVGFAALGRVAELPARKADRPARETARHRLDLTPACRAALLVALVQIKTRIVGGRAPPFGLSAQDQVDGLRFERHAGRLIETIGVRLFFLGMGRYIRNEGPAADAS